MNTRQVIISIQYWALSEYLDKMTLEDHSEAYHKRMKRLHLRLERLAQEFWDEAEIQPMDAIIPPPPPPPPPPPDDDI